LKRAGAIVVAAALLGSGCSDLLGLDFDGYREEGAASSGTASSGGAGGSSGSSGGAGGNGGTPVECAATLLACDGACRDPSTDGEHCGACNHDCFGGDCSGSICQPVVVTQDADGPDGIVVVGDALFWVTDGGFVRRIDLDGGGAPVVIEERGPASNLTGLVTDGSTLFYTATGAGEVRRIDLDGTNDETIKTSALPTDIALGDSSVYWITSNGQIHLTPKEGSPDNSLQIGLDNVSGMAVSGTFAFFGVHEDGGGVYRHDFFAGSGNLTVAADQDYPRTVRVRGTSVFWTSDLGNSVASAPLVGGGPTTLATNQPGATGLHVDQDGVYWANVDDGTIRFLADGADTPVVLASGQDGPRSLTSDDGSVYWTNDSPSDPAVGQVMRVAKPLPAR
jgi:sugar lactone lactonase YvrE